MAGLFGIKRRETAPLRLPQDVFADGDRAGVPNLLSLTESVEYYDTTLREAHDLGSHHDRAMACWGLVANGRDALPWARHLITARDDRLAVDAAGVLITVGIPHEWIGKLQELVANRPASPAMELLSRALPTLGSPVRQSPARQDTGHQDARHQDARHQDARHQDLPPVGAPLNDPIHEIHPAEPATGTVPAIDPSVVFGNPLDVFLNEVIFVEGSLEEIITEDRRQWRELQQRRSRPDRSMKIIQGSLEELLFHLEPHQVTGTKSLWVQAANGWIAQFHQGNASHRSLTLANNLRARSLWTRFKTHVEANGYIEQYGMSTFSLNDPLAEEEMQSSPLRHIEAVFDNGWEWITYGQIQPFEEPRHYENEFVLDRLELKTLLSYCDSLGIRRNDPSFYGPTAVLVEDLPD